MAGVNVKLCFTGDVDAQELPPVERELGAHDRAFRTRSARAVALDADNARVLDQRHVEGHGLFGLAIEHQERRDVGPMRLPLRLHRVETPCASRAGRAPRQGHCSTPRFAAGAQEDRGEPACDQGQSGLQRWRWLLSPCMADACDEIKGKTAESPLHTRKPVSGEDVRLTTGFGMRLHPLLNTRKMHTGIDWAAPIGTPVLAARGGRVVSARTEGELGNAVRIDHGAGWQTLYAHLSGLQRARRRLRRPARRHRQSRRDWPDGRSRAALRGAGERPADRPAVAAIQRCRVACRGRNSSWPSQPCSAAHMARSRSAVQTRGVSMPWASS